MTTTREEEIDWQHVAKHGLAKVTPEHTWAEWLADRNAEIERLEAEITRLRSASQAGGVPAGWMDMADAPRTRPIIVLTAGGRIIKAKWVIIGDDAVGWGTPDEDDPHPNCWHTGFCWASNEDEEPSDPPVGWIEIPSASPPPPATDGDALREALEKIDAEFDRQVYGLPPREDPTPYALREADQDIPADYQHCVVITEGLWGEIRNALASSPPPVAGTVGRFDHHADPAVDFCWEVDAIEGLVHDVTIGMAKAEEVQARIDRAMSFRVRGDKWAVRAKQTLRDLEKRLKAFTPVSATDAVEAERAIRADEREATCPHCNGAGDVHRADGEWLGVCDCPAGAAIRARGTENGEQS